MIPTKTMQFAILLVTVSLPLSLAAATTCPTTIIRDGSFESGARPPTADWTVDMLSGGSNTNYDLTSPGSSGRYAFTAYINPGGIPYSDGSERLGQLLSTCAGQNYSIIADIRFQNTASNDCSVKLDYPYKYERGSVTTPSGLGPAGVWAPISATFQATSSGSRIYFYFTCANRRYNVISLDNVRVAPYNGNAY